MPRTRFAEVKTDSRNLITPTTNFAEVKTDYRNFYMPVTPLVRFEFRKSCRRPVEVWRVRFAFHKAHRTSTKRNFRTSTKKFGNSRKKFGLSVLTSPKPLQKSNSKLTFQTFSRCVYVFLLSKRTLRTSTSLLHALQKSKRTLY